MSGRVHPSTTWHSRCQSTLMGLTLSLFLVSGHLLHAGPESNPAPRHHVPLPYAVDRYFTLWTSFCLSRPEAKPKAENVPSAPTPQSVCNFSLEGIAESDGTRYVYLCDKNTGVTHELIPNRAVGDLEVLKVSLGDEPAKHKVSFRSGSETYLLGFDLTENAVATASPNPARTATPPLTPPQAGAKPVSRREAIEAKMRSLKDEDDGWIDQPDGDPASRKGGS